MRYLLPLTVFLMYLLQSSAEEYVKAEKCFSNTDSSKRLSISMLSRRKEETSKWLTEFIALHESKNSSVANNIMADVSHSVTECEGMTRIRITGLLAEDVSRFEGPFARYWSDVLLFDPKCGTNVAITTNRRTVQKLNLEIGLESVVFTNRPLKNDELFEVRLDKKHNKFTSSLGIGATTHSPEEIAIANHINHFPHPTWAMYHGSTYQNGSIAIKNYGRDLDALVVGDRVGVMRSSVGNMHFYVNGVDQGPAASNVPYPVYGMLELYLNAAKATIIHS